MQADGFRERSPMGEGGEGKFRMRRDHRSYDSEKVAPNAIDEGFKRGEYKLPRAARRYLHLRMQPYAGRPRLMMAIQRVAWIIGRYHTGSENFVGRGLARGPQGKGFILARKPLAEKYADLTEALIREAVRFLLNIGWIVRQSPEGELFEIKKAPKKSKTGRGYFRRALKGAWEDGQFRAPVVFYRLGTAARDIHAKTLQPQKVQGREFVGEPVWIIPSNIVSLLNGNVEGVYTGSRPEGSDPRFQARPVPDPFPRPSQPPGIDYWTRLKAERDAERSGWQVSERKFALAADLAARAARRLAGDSGL